MLAPLRIRESDEYTSVEGPIGYCGVYGVDPEKKVTHLQCHIESHQNGRREMTRTAFLGHWIDFYVEFVNTYRYSYTPYRDFVGSRTSRYNVVLECLEDGSSQRASRYHALTEHFIASFKSPLTVPGVWRVTLKEHDSEILSHDFEVIDPLEAAQRIRVERFGLLAVDTSGSAFPIRGFVVPGQTICLRPVIRVDAPFHTSLAVYPLTVSLAVQGETIHEHPGFFAIEEENAPVPLRDVPIHNITLNEDSVAAVVAIHTGKTLLARKEVTFLKTPPAFAEVQQTIIEARELSGYSTSTKKPPPRTLAGSPAGNHEKEASFTEYVRKKRRRP